MKKMTHARQNYRVRLLMLSLLAGALALPAFAVTASPATGTPVPLGGAVDESGYLAQYDRPVKAGAELAIKAVNQNGGVLGGRPLKITFYNMEGNPAKGVQVVQRLLTSQGVVAIVHGFSSASTRAIQPIVAGREVPVIAASVVPGQAPAYEFSTIAPSRFQIQIRIEYLLKHGIHKIGVLDDGTPYNKLQLDALRKEAEAHKITIAAVEQHASDAVDLRPQVTALLQKGVKAIIKLSAGPTEIVAAKAMTQAGTDIPLIASIDSLKTHRQAAKAYTHYLAVATGPALYGALPASERSKSLVAFMKLYDASDLTKYDPTYTGRGWDAVMILAKAIDKAGTTKGPALQKALEEMPPYAGASGLYDFSSASHYGIQRDPFRIMGFDANGHVKIVFTPTE